MQDTKICGPEGRDCIEENSAQTFDCSFACEGMYAGVNWKGRRVIKIEMDKEKYNMLSNQYVNFKRNSVKHFEFSSASPSYMYGELILNFTKDNMK